MKRVVTKFFVSITAMTLLLSTIFAPVASAATANFSTEVAVKNGLYALAAYECISNNVLQDTAIGNKISSIIPQVGSSKVFIGQWLGDENGMISCETAITKSLGSGNITEDMLGAGKMFNGVYEKDATGEQKIKCNYGIINSSGNALQSGTYSWPQGYFSDAYGDIQDKRSHGVIEVVFDEDGPIRLEGSTGDIDTNYVLESMRNITIKWGEPAKICTPLVKYTEVYSSAGVNAFNESMTFYSSIEATDDDTPFNETIDWYDGTNEYDAWVGGTVSTNPRYTFALTPVTSSKLKLANDAKAKLLSNLATLKTGGATNVTDFLNSNPDAKYIVYGRYLFNGDGNASFACNGISVATDDPNFSNLNATDYWDVSQPYVAAVNAYKNGSASSKSSYRTKFGGNGILDPGSARSIAFPGVVGDCKTLAGEFNGINPSSSTAKLKVSNYMKVATVEELPEENDPGTTGGGSAGNGNNGGSSGSSTDLDQCFSSAGALGWILCPVISFVSSATDSIYNDYIQSEFLEVKAENISTGSDLYKSWQAIRNIANILFIIMFVLVVLSQITGLGISNYGIKKILPRLIIVAVLVNISFLLCQFAVDLSNILGYSLNDIFVKLSPDVDKGMGTLGNVGSGIASALTWGGIALLAINTAGAWLIPLLLALLTGIISVIFGGIILGLRQAGIIVLVVLAPVAIVCYALPNAKNFFDRWLKMFISLLMVFPICGALMGGGFFASNLIVNSTDSVLLSIIAMLIRVAPFFMIPSLVRTSLMAIGNIGNKVANWGNKMGRTATGAIAKSDFVRQRDADLAKFQGDTTALRGRMLNRVLRKDPSKLSDRRKAKVARQYAKYNKLRGEEATAFPYAMSPGSREYTAAQNAAHQKRISTLADNIAAENIDVATDAEELEKRLDQAMVDYNSSGSDEDLASLQAFNNMLISNGDNGISAIQNSLGRANEAGLDRSVQALGQHLINSHTKDIKPVARELFGAAGAAAAGELRQGMFTEDKDGMYTSLSHLKSSVGGYDASSIGKMNETSLQRMINNSSELKKDEKFVKTFDLLSSNSLTNPNIHVQPKVAEKMNKLRSELGLTQIENNSGISPNSGGSSSSSDSGRIQIQGNNDNGNGTIVQTGNDDRSRRPLPSAVREGNNYRQNDSGIWLPPNHN